MQKKRQTHRKGGQLPASKGIIQRQIELTPQKDKVKLADAIFRKLAEGVAWTSTTTEWVNFGFWVDEMVYRVYWPNL